VGFSYVFFGGDETKRYYSNVDRVSMALAGTVDDDGGLVDSCLGNQYFKEHGVIETNFLKTSCLFLKTPCLFWSKPPVPFDACNMMSISGSASWWQVW